MKTSWVNFLHLLREKDKWNNLFIWVETIVCDPDLHQLQVCEHWKSGGKTLSYFTIMCSLSDFSTYFKVWWSAPFWFFCHQGKSDILFVISEVQSELNQSLLLKWLEFLNYKGFMHQINVVTLQSRCWSVLQITSVIGGISIIQVFLVI